MKKLRTRCTATFLSMVVAQIASFCLATTAQSGNVDFNSNGTVRLSVGQIVHATPHRAQLPGFRDTLWLDGFWTEAIRANFSLTALVNQRLTIAMEMIGGTAFDFPSPYYAPRTPRTQRSAYSNLRAAYTSYDIIKDGLSFTLGYFPYSAAPESRNLGDYMFRTGVYPGYIISGREQARVAGLMLSAPYPSNFRHDLLATIEVDIEPQYDWSLTYVGRYNLHDWLKLSAGVMLSRILPAIPERTNPTSLEYMPNIYKIGYVDPTTGDTTFYRKTGVKLVGRLALDVRKLLFPRSARLGEQDLVTYVEAAFLGVKDYPGYYEHPSERVPVMLGFNLPVFKLLDVLNVELEYYRSPYWNNPVYQGYAIPYEDWDYSTIPDPKADLGWRSTAQRLRWSVYGQRSFFRGMALYAQAASDHLRPSDGTGEYERYEVFSAPDEWYWQAGLMFRF
ncbi:MAG: hypothetical protein GF418_13595 [Chitinivibrionales bacterium]|nr:hypothetical protein [Chitinivibrionales bacterium]MBD3396654.1 hypothetical protein [Chitinivibrionales bacterium]